MNNSTPALLPGDILLYDSGDFFSGLIKFRTWSDVGHVEIYLDAGQSAASRNGLGVAEYPVRWNGLKYIRRPTGTFNLLAAREYTTRLTGTPYGWMDLGRFYLLKLPTSGMICSQFGDLCLRQAGITAFAEDYPAGAVSPRDFLVTPLAKTIWRYTPNTSS